MVDTESLKDDIEILRADVARVSERHMNYVEAHHKLEKEVVAIKTDLSYILKGQESMNANMTRLMFIVVGSFVAALVGFIVKGGLVL